MRRRGNAKSIRVCMHVQDMHIYRCIICACIVVYARISVQLIPKGCNGNMVHNWEHFGFIRRTFVFSGWKSNNGLMGDCFLHNFLFSNKSTIDIVFDVEKHPLICCSVFFLNIRISLAIFLAKCQVWKSSFYMSISEAMIKRLDDRRGFLFPGDEIVLTWLHCPMRKRFAVPAGYDSCDLVR